MQLYERWRDTGESGRAHSTVFPCKWAVNPFGVFGPMNVEDVCNLTEISKLAYSNSKQHLSSKSLRPVPE